MRFVSGMMLILSLPLGAWVYKGCSKPLTLDSRINAHWIEQNETAPYRCILLNDFTYLKMRQKINECEGE